MFDRFMKKIERPNDKKPGLEKDAVARMLRVDPAALEAFEAAYAKHALSREPADFFATNSRQAAESKRIVDADGVDERAALEDIVRLQRRIVNELLAQTEVYVFDGKLARTKKPAALPDGVEPVRNDDISCLPASLRPQLAGDLMQVDIGEPSYPHLLKLYKMSLEERDVKKQKQAYHMFRQGLDILDLDPVTYEIIGTNPNSMGHWLPELVEACAGQEFFQIPATTVAKVPMPLLQLTRQEYRELTRTTLDIVDRWAREAFGLDIGKEYFIKTGTYSSKFDFRNCHVHGEKEVKELGEYLLYIHYQANQMASPLSTPCIYGASTTNEWVVREFIPDKEKNPCIYKGLPLHTEYRVFVDCNTDQVIGIAPYWEPGTMTQRFGHEEDADSPHQVHDYVIYKMHEETLMKRYYANKDTVQAHVEAILPALNLKGQWSIDVMQNGEDFWIIDMALAENSAFYNYIPEHLRRPSKENWIPQLPVSKIKD